MYRERDDVSIGSSRHSMARYERERLDSREYYVRDRWLPPGAHESRIERPSERRSRSVKSDRLSERDEGEARELARLSRNLHDQKELLTDLRLLNSKGVGENTTVFLGKRGSVPAAEGHLSLERLMLQFLEMNESVSRSDDVVGCNERWQSFLAGRVPEIQKQQEASVERYHLNELRRIVGHINDLKETHDKFGILLTGHNRRLPKYEPAPALSVLDVEKGAGLQEFLKDEARVVGDLVQDLEATLAEAEQAHREAPLQLREAEDEIADLVQRNRELLRELREADARVDDTEQLLSDTRADHDDIHAALDDLRMTAMSLGAPGSLEREPRSRHRSASGSGGRAPNNVRERITAVTEILIKLGPDDLRSGGASGLRRELESLEELREKDLKRMDQMSDEIERLQAMGGRSGSGDDGLARENRALRKQVQDAEEEIQRLERGAHADARRIDELTEDLLRAEGSSDLMRENESLRRELHTLEELRETDARRIDHMGQEIDRLLVDPSSHPNDALTSELRESLLASEEKCRQLMEKNNADQDHYEELLEELSLLRDRNKQLHTEIRAAREMSGVPQSVSTKEGDDARELRDRLDMSEKDVQRLRTEVSGLKKNNQRLQETLNDMRSERETKTGVDDLYDEIDSLKQQLQDVRRGSSASRSPPRRDSTDGSKRRIEHLEEELVKARSDVKRLTNELLEVTKENENLNEGIREMRHQNRSGQVERQDKMHEELISLKYQLVGAERKLQDFQDGHREDEEVHQLQDELVELRQQVAATEQQVHEVTTSCRAGDVDQVYEELQTLRQQLHSADTQLRELRAPEQSEIERLLDEIDTLREDVRLSENAVAENVRLEEELKRVNEELRIVAAAASTDGLYSEMHARGYEESENNESGMNRIKRQPERRTSVSEDQRFATLQSEIEYLREELSRASGMQASEKQVLDKNVQTLFSFVQSFSEADGADSNHDALVAELEEELQLFQQKLEDTNLQLHQSQTRERDLEEALEAFNREGDGASDLQQQVEHLTQLLDERDRQLQEAYDELEREDTRQQDREETTEQQERTKALEVALTKLQSEELRDHDGLVEDLQELMHSLKRRDSDHNKRRLAEMQEQLYLEKQNHLLQRELQERAHREAMAELRSQHRRETSPVRKRTTGTGTTAAATRTSATATPQARRAPAKRRPKIQKHKYAFLGLELGALRSELGGHGGLRVVDVRGPALAAGLQQGDVITEVEGVATETQEDLKRVLQKHPPQQAVYMKLVRDETLYEVDVQPGEREIAPGQGAKYTAKVIVKQRPPTYQTARSPPRTYAPPPMPATPPAPPSRVLAARELTHQANEIFRKHNLIGSGTNVPPPPASVGGLRS